MRKKILILFIIALPITLLGQKGVIKVLNGEVVEGHLFFEKLYLFEQFQEGRAMLNDGRQYRGLLNINNLTQSVNIITERGDTTSLKEESRVETVSSDGRFFRKLRGGYIEILDGDSKVSIGRVRKLSIGQEKLVGAYGATSDVSSISKITSIENESGIRAIVGYNNVEFSYDERLFLITKNRMVLPTKKNFERLFSKEKREIGHYLEEKRNRLSTQEEIIELFSWLIATEN